MKSDDPWFIARDGQQHGPLNETEMKLFVDRGHLRATDLIWRQGFPDWRPAFSVFPPKTQPVPPTSATTPLSPTTRQPGSGPDLGGKMAGPASSPLQTSTEPQSHGTFGNSDASASDNIEQDLGLDAGTAPRWGRAIAATLIVGTLAGTGLWLYTNGTPSIFKQAGTASEAVPVVKAPKSADATPKQKTSTPQPPKPARVNIDARLQKGELWQFLKGQYPRWYGNVLKNAGQIEQDASFDRKLSELLVTRLVELRRQNADKVLAASPQNLTAVASTFLDNLKHLAGRGPEPCYTFISKGETSPAVIDAMRDPGAKAPIHSQLLATFKASVEGAKTPVTREAPQKSDYQALTSQLAKIGWNKEDIQLFANPKALSQAPPARVCQMVQDWFTAHLSLENAETQERLLHETLRPVVSG